MTIHDGHRQRMRDRFRADGLEGFAQHEVLELLLYYAKARGDMNPLAHALLDEFGSLKGVLEASTDQLMTVKGVGQETATLISMIVPMFRKYQECLCAETQRLCHRSVSERYCRMLLAGLRYERLYMISLSASGKVLGQRLISEGSLAEVQAYPRKVVEAALNHNASGVILCHNHPGGTAEPSLSDFQVTKNIEAVLHHLGILLLDHVVVAGEDTYSMCAHEKLAHTILRKVSGGDCCREGDEEYVWRNEGELD